MKLKILQNMIAKIKWEDHIAIMEVMRQFGVAGRAGGAEVATWEAQKGTGKL